MELTGKQPGIGLTLHEKGGDRGETPIPQADLQRLQEEIWFAFQMASSEACQAVMHS